MKTYTFTIHGNQEKADGNPIPYFRSTQGSFFNKGSRRYQAWKDYVRKEFFDEMRNTLKSSEYNQLELTALVNSTGKGKPIMLGPEETASVEMGICWANRAHGDIDNVFKGIMDALFVNDKRITSAHIEGVEVDSKKGSVDVKIVITEH